MFGLDQTVTKIIGGVLLVLALFGFGYYKGHSAVQAKFDTYKAEVQAAAEQQAQKAKEIDAKNQKLFQETKNAYNTQLASLRAYYSLRNTKGSGSLPSVSYPAAGITEYTPDNLPPASVLAGQCAETTLTLISLQNWAVNAQKTYQ